jgi:hypothetical protein
MIAAIPPSDTPFSNPRAGNSGLVPVQNNASIEAEKLKIATTTNDSILVRSLAGMVQKCFAAAKSEKDEVEQRMLRSCRARRGEYDPDTLAKIRATGTSEVYMMLSSAKARAATAILRDVFLGNGGEKPWSLSPTKEPELPQMQMDAAIMRAGELVQQIQDMMGGPQAVPESQVEELLELARSRGQMEVMLDAKKSMLRMESKMEDQLQEGGFTKALSDFIDDLSTFPSAILKGPVIRNKPQLTWIPAEDGSYSPQTVSRLTPEWERVSPFNIYPAPGSSDVNDGYIIELHKLRPHALEELIGVDGYSEGAIKAVIAAYGTGGLREFTTIDSARADVEGKTSLSLSDSTSPTISAIQYWGPVLGKELIEHGMDESKVGDVTKTYHCEIWVIGTWVIKAILNYDPLGRTPYFKGSYEDLPGSFWGNSPIDLIADCQTTCNNAARAMTNNMAIASGPQVVLNIDRLPPGENPSNLYPWKLHQVTSDPYGNNSSPVTFFQPSSNAQELMGIYDKFALLADEYSGIPRYVTGEGPAAGAGRTASGLSMMLASSGKIIKSVALGVDLNVLGPAIERLFYHNMRYGTDPELKNTDVKVVARGAASLIIKETAQVRRSEFLGLILNSPLVAQVVGEEAIADLLRATASGLDLDTDKLIPPPEVIRARLFQQQQQAVQQQQMAQQQAMMGQDVPLEQMNIQRDPSGAMTGMQVMPGKPGGGQQLMNGAPATDLFSPTRQ